MSDQSDYETHTEVVAALLEEIDERGGIKTIDQGLAAAQVHATLALAAATREADLHHGHVTVRYAGEV